MQKNKYKVTMDGLKLERITRDEKFDMVIKHWHKECEIYFLVEGERYFFVGNRTYRINRGCLVIVDSDQLHRTNNVKEFYHERIMMQLDKEKFLQSAAAVGFDLMRFFKEYEGVTEIETAQIPYIEALFDSMALELQQKKLGYEIVVQGKMMELWLLLIRNHQKFGDHRKIFAATTDKHKIVYRVASYICENYKEAETLDKIAKEFFLSKSYLSRIYKEVTGFTVNEYINIQRVRQAQMLLEDTGLDVAEIAHAVGYENETYFSRIFHKYVGMTALQYRRKKTEYKKQMRE